MSLKLDNLETFKKHRNEISESLNNVIVGREKEINDICNLLGKNNFVAITGHAGIGKSRVAVAVIEKYCSENKGVNVICVKSFGDYISAIDELIEGSKKYIFLIDDASNFGKLNEVIECLKYYRTNVQAIFTVRDYLKDCIDDEAISFYEICPLNDESIKKAIIENTTIKNNEWIDKIVDISKGNIRFAFIAANVALKDEKGFFSLFNVKDIMNSFYKEQIVKMSKSSNLLISAGIISFFKSIYLNQLFYISPILKIAGISKQEFLKNVDILISMELVDELVGVVKLADQCFADYLLNYVFIEKRYLKIKDLIVSTYKYYKKRIIESLNSILSTCLADESISYLKGEALDSCALIEDIDLKHEIEVAFAPLMLDYVAAEFKKGVENYTEKKDIKWLLKLFKTLAKTKYQSIAIIGIMLLLKKTNSKKEDIFKVINDTYTFDYDSVRTSFVYLDFFVKYLIDNNIYDDHFLSLVSSYLKYSFRNSKFYSDKKIEFCSFNIRDDMNGIMPFRRNCWVYLFGYDLDKVLNVIIDFAKYHIRVDIEDTVKSDIEVINEHLENYECKELIKAVLYEEFKGDNKNCKLDIKQFSSVKYSDILSIILEKKTHGQDYNEFMKIHKEKVHTFYSIHKTNIFEMLNSIDRISNYYYQNIQDFLLIVLEYLDQYSKSILNTFIQYKVYPSKVVEKISSIIGLDTLYYEILNISDKSMKEEYFYAFYSLINMHEEKNIFGFNDWINSKQDLEAKPIFQKSAFSLRKIAENSGIPYINLVKIIFKKRINNEAIAKEYLSYLFFKNGAFKELLELDKKLAIKIYEFLISLKENDYQNNALKEIISVKRNYIKTMARRCFENEITDEGGLVEIIFKDGNCKLFFNECVEIGKENFLYFVPFVLQQLVSENIKNKNMFDWVLNYIDKKHNDIKGMEYLFTLLSGIDSNYRNLFIIKYYEKGKDEKVLNCALFTRYESCSFGSTDSYFKTKIKSLESLKIELIKWNNLNLISFIDEFIEGYKEDAKNSKINQLIEYVDPDVLNELKEIDVKTEVSLTDAFKLYLDDEHFRRILSSGYVTYKDGCFVSDSNTPLKFRDVLNEKKNYRYKNYCG